MKPALVAAGMLLLVVSACLIFQLGSSLIANAKSFSAMPLWTLPIFLLAFFGGLYAVFGYHAYLEAKYGGGQL